MFIVTAIETVGDISACVEGGMDREATDSELSGGVICDGIGSSFAALFGVLPNTSFSQNVGLVSMTKVVNRFAISMGAIFLVICGFCPKIGALMSIMPQSVLGGATVFFRLFLPHTALPHMHTGLFLLLHRHTISIFYYFIP